jgi:hypothetical protein
LPIVDVSVYHAVIVSVGPYRAGKSAYRSADNRSLEDACARKNRTGSSAEHRAAERPGYDCMGRWIISWRRTRIILAIVSVARHISAVVRIRPDCTRKPADRCADCGTFNHSDARSNGSDYSAARRADGGAFSDMRIVRARAQHGGTS